MRCAEWHATVHQGYSDHTSGNRKKEHVDVFINAMKKARKSSRSWRTINREIGGMDEFLQTPLSNTDMAQ